MKIFKSLIKFEYWIRKNRRLYFTLRRLAPYITYLFDLEPEFKVLKHIHKPAEYCAIDIGFNDGMSTIAMGRYFNNTIEAFEPNLNENLIVWKILKRRKNLKMHKIGLGDEKGELELQIPILDGVELDPYASIDKSSILWRMEFDLKTTQGESTFKSKKIQIEMLDNFNLKPFFIKIDTEGYEFQIIIGALKTISIYKPLIMIEVGNQMEIDRLLRILQPLGYKAYYKRGRYFVETVTHISLKRNYIFSVERI
jgi:FkbM family methyltransferase